MLFEKELVSFWALWINFVFRVTFKDIIVFTSDLKQCLTPLILIDLFFFLIIRAHCSLSLQNTLFVFFYQSLNSTVRGNLFRQLVLWAQNRYARPKKKQLLYHLYMPSSAGCV